MKVFIVAVLFGFSAAAKQPVKATVSNLRYDQSKDILVCESGTHLVRVDNVSPESDEKVRYRSFKIGKPKESKPELELTGTASFEGSAHNATYTFKSGSYVYEIQDDAVCSDDEYDKSIGRCMPQLTVSKGTKTISSAKCHP